MKVDRFTKAVLTGIFLCLVLLTLKEYDIISDAEAAKASITDVNIKKINGIRIKDAPTGNNSFNGLPVVIYASSGYPSPAHPIESDGQNRLNVKTY